MDTTKPQLIRALGLREGIAIHMGVIIGSGIFIVPATIAGHVPATGPMILVWVVAGLLSLFGALSVAELSAIMPQAGGPYVYLRNSFGRIWGFLFSWNDFFINKAGSAAAIAVGFATFLGYFVPALDDASLLVTQLAFLGLDFEVNIGWIQIVAIGVIAVVTLINIRGVQFGGWVMTIFTSAKVLALIGLIVAVFFSGNGSAANFRPWWPETWSSDLTAGFGLALISALWAYDGWIDVTLTAGEFKNPSRNVPLSLLLGTVAVIVLYVGANIAYAFVIPIDAMQGSSRIAADVALTALGPVGATLIVIGILCSTFGSTNGMLLNGPRSIFAAAADGAALKALGTVHPRHHSPWVAVVTLGVWSALLTLSGTYDQITAYVVFGSWVFYGLAAASVIILRRKMPDVERPFRTWGYPYLTILFLLVVTWFLANTLLENTRDAVIGMVLLIIGLPLYYYWTWQSRANNQSEVS
ncbi:MAG: amino acid permease [Bacteroidota bacterium]